MSEKCEICVKFKKPPPKPIVSIPLASKLNETVSMDLKFWKGIYFLVIVDIATRFCVACVIRDKKPSTIIKMFLRSWVSIFGAPNKVLTDNGGEFNNPEMRQFGESFNVKIMTTSAESPWSNGVCERLNAVLGSSVEKIMADTEGDVDVALAWAVAARNALANFSGYSPNQLVFGYNPVLPNVISDKPPALEEVTASKMVRENLNAMHVARNEFLRLESNEKLRRALRSNVRSTLSENVVNGDEVFYKRNDRSEWHGPGIVIGRDGKQILVRHGGTYVRVHACRLNRSVTELDKTPHEKVDMVVPRVESIVNDSPEENADSSDGENIAEEGHASTAIETDVRPICENIDNATITDIGAACSVNTISGSKEKLSSGTKFKIGQRFEGIDSNTGEVLCGKIISRAGKATGKHKSCFNIKSDRDGATTWIDMDKVNDLKIVPDTEERVVMFSSNDVCIAKEKEIDNWLENEVYEEVEDIGQECISVRWVITEKIKGGETVTKARLVARGFEEDTMSIRKDSPTCSRESVRLAICLATSYGWKIHSVDIKAAYLQGEAISREVFLKPPPEYNCGKVWKLKKTVYGLCDAARAWYNRVKNVLFSMSVEMCALEPSLFYWYNGNKLEGIICVYVDDFLWAGTQGFEREIVNKIKASFLISDSQSQSFQYIGLNILSEKGKTSIDQNQYVMSLSPVKLSPGRSANKSSELSEAEKRDYRGVVGQLNWIATNSRPDISFEVCDLAVSFKNACVKDMLRLNKLVKWVQEELYKINFFQLKGLESCTLECFTDASFANLSDSSSQGGFVIFIRDSNGVRCPIQWQSRKIRRVVKSTLAAEALALLDGAEATVYIARVFKEIIRKEFKIHCIVDNKSLYDAVYSSNVIEDRRLRIDLAVLRNMLENGEIHRVSWVATSQQLADCLTKRGASTQQLRAAFSGH